MADSADMNEILELMKKDRFATENGMEIVKVKPGYAEARMKIEPRHLNGYGTVMGGVLFTLADYAFAAASNAKNPGTVTSNSSISFFRPPAGDFILAKATEVVGGRRLCTYNIDVFDGEDTLVARYTGTGYIKGQRSAE